MWVWLKELDDLLRGRKSEPKLLAEGTEQFRVGPFLTAVIVLGLIYGVFMGLFAILNRTPPCYSQLVASTVKVPALFLLTLVVTFPSLYVFSALLNTRLSLAGTLRIVMASLAVTLAVLASLGPITGFFSLTTSSYPFMKLLNFSFFAAAGFIGLKFLLTLLRRLETVVESETAPTDLEKPQPIESEEESSPAPSTGAEGWGTHIPKARLIQQQSQKPRSGKVFRVWLILYALVGMQMGWVLRPFIGSPDLQFTWFRARESNIFMGILRTISELLTG